MKCRVPECDDPASWVVGKPNRTKRGIAHFIDRQGNVVVVCGYHAKCILAESLTRNESVSLEPMLT